jgi:hypothetical protein
VEVIRKQEFVAVYFCNNPNSSGTDWNIT